MFYLNLLPPNEKKQYYFVSLERLVNYYAFMILGAFFLLLVVLVGAKYFLIWRAGVFEQAASQDRFGEIAREIRGMEEKIQETNKLLGLANKVNSQKTEFSGILYDISSIRPPGLSFKTLSYKKDTKEFILAGKSQTRDEFLVFLEKLEKNSRFKEIDSPLSNLVKKENLDFRIRFIFKTDNNP